MPEQQPARRFADYKANPAGSMDAPVGGELPRYDADRYDEFDAMREVVDAQTAEQKHTTEFSEQKENQ